ncbi:MAG: XRE family transcriptional regulator [Anaerolineaceae bacterium]|nr:XRE family transcriptional regulator [Anaerolineaceae bacterium]
MDDPDNSQSIGSRIRVRRNELQLSLRDLASQTELTASFLSQLERGQTNASVDSIRKICSALGISLLSLLPEEPLPDAQQATSRLYSPLVRSNERPRISFPDIQVTYELFTPDLSRKMEGFFVRLEPGKGNIAHQLREPTEECIFVLAGTLTIELESGRYELNKHDSIYFEGMKLRKLANNSSEEAVWISIITPPVF